MKSSTPSSAIIDALAEDAFACGWKLLQPHRFAQTDEAHVAVLLGIGNFPQGARVLDVGCGFGECARLMMAARPDLSFDLLNFSEKQLAKCPHGFALHHGDAHALPFADETFDAVMFNAALGNMDAMVALAEACRVLKPHGVVLLNELRRTAGDNTAMERAVMFRAYSEPDLLAFARDIGFESVATQTPPVAIEYLREQWPESEQASYDEAFAGTEPVVWRMVKGSTTSIAARFGYLFHKHQRIALQVSGGKDSLAVLHALRPWLDRLCVYWVNPGNPFPETVAFMEGVRAAVPHFREVAGRQREIIASDGWPSDVVPIKWSSAGQFVFGPKPFMVQGRLDCCWRSLMLPMHQAIIADGVTCIIRGKRADEADKTETRTGSVIDGIETIYPIWDWSAQQVFSYIDMAGLEMPAYYEHASHSLDCMDCTAWWGEGLSPFLAARYPTHFEQYVERIGKIKAAVADELANCEV